MGTRVGLGVGRNVGRRDGFNEGAKWIYLFVIIKTMRKTYLVLVLLLGSKKAWQRELRTRRNKIMFREIKEMKLSNTYHRLESLLGFLWGWRSGPKKDST